MDNIREAVDAQDFVNAFHLLKEYLTIHPGYTDTVAILEASIYIGLGDFCAALPCIQEGIRINPVNYELYYMLGMVYESFSEYDKAYLCFENALFHSREHQDDYAVIQEYFQHFMNTTGTFVPRASIILLNFNQLAYTIDCISSIRKFCPASAYEMIVVDNGSLESPEKWLRTQPDIRYQINKENLGFAGGCNAGIRLANPGNDIFLLNNDTLMTENALFWLRMGLYEKKEIGASGAVSNSTGYLQAVPGNFNSVSECMEYGFTHNVPLEQPLSYRTLLIGFAMLIKHTAFEKTGLLDERFFPGNYEDNDYCTRLIRNGYLLVACENSFIYHVGKSGFSSLEKQDPSDTYQNCIDINCHRYFEKWHIKPDHSFVCRMELVDLISPADKEAPIVCLDVGCACGATLMEIKSRYPNARLYGIESDPACAEFSSHFATVIQGNAETIDFPFDVSFDYVILGSILEELIHPELLLKKLKAHLSEHGVMIASIPNILHYTAISKILMGSFSYSDFGVPGQTHLRFFTLYDSIQLLRDSGYEIVNLHEQIEKPTEAMSAMNDFLNSLSSIPGVVDKEQFYVTQYVFKAKAASL